jgi:hypothetical protein
VLLLDTSRPTDALAALSRLRDLRGNKFYITAHASLLASTHLMRKDYDSAQQALAEGRRDGASEENIKAVEALIAARKGLRDEARQTLVELKDTQGLAAGALSALAEIAVLLGEPELGVAFLERPLMGGLAPTFIRMDPALHTLLDHPPFAPRLSEKTLVWPIEAPMMDRSILPLFREIRIDTGLPQMSQVRVTQS